MMSKVKDGMRVRVKAREASVEEAKNGRYAPYLSHATGTVLKVYSGKEIAVNLDLDSLHPDIVTRHKKQQQAMHQKWLDSLSEEARNRLTPEEKAFRLNYIVLLPESDLLTGKAAEAPVKKQTKATEAKPEPQPAKTSAAQSVQAAATMPTVDKTSPSKKKTADKSSGQVTGENGKAASSRGKTVADSKAKERAKAAENTGKKTKVEAARPAVRSPKPATSSPKSKTSSPKLETKSARNPKSKAQNPKAIPTPKRLTSADLEAQEEEYLKSKRKRS